MLNFLGPWIEGSTGGVGERVRFLPSINTGSRRPVFTRIMLLNGVIDYERPYLFEYNNRAKKIRIHWLISGEYLDLELEDTPHFQMFYLGEIFRLENYTFDIEILEVYRGTRYE